MDSDEQAQAYASADFSDANKIFLSNMLSVSSSLHGKAILDVGCGDGEIIIALARTTITTTISMAITILAIATMTTTVTITNNTNNNSKEGNIVTTIDSQP